jgi:type I restriction enzyme, S subunit
MSGRLKAGYRNRKPTGLYWLAEMPAHWKIHRLKFTIAGCYNGIWGDEPDGGENDIACVRVADFDRLTFRINAHISTIRSVTSAERRRRELLPGDLLLEKSGGGASQPVGAVALYEHPLQAVCSNFVARMPVKPSYDSRFLSYLHAALYTAGINERSIKQTTGIQNLDSDSYLSEHVPVPPPEEQRAIAVFLDRETARIDALVEEKRRLLDLLQEKTTAIITQAVTCGLDRSEPNKKGPFTWLDKIPHSWRIMSLARLTTKLTNGYVGPTRDLFVDEGVPYLQSLHIKKNKIEFSGDYFVTAKWSREHAKSIVHEGDVLVVQTGDIGQVAHVPKAWEGANCHALIICTPNARYIKGEYLAWLLASAFGQASLLSRQTGALHPHLNCGVIKHMLLPVPPLPQQKAIVEHIDTTVTQIWHLKKKAENSIALLSEKREALVAAAVTGQIELRHTDEWRSIQKSA